MLAPRSHSRISGRYFDSSRAGVCAKPECLDASEINEPHIKWESEIHKVVPNYGMSRGQYPFLLLRKDGKPLLAEHRHYATVKRAKEAAEREACVQKTTDTAGHHTGPELKLAV
jgi:hypothetical protein